MTLIDKIIKILINYKYKRKPFMTWSWGIDNIHEINILSAEYYNDHYRYGTKEEWYNEKSEELKGHRRKFEEIVVEYPPVELCTYPEYRGKPYFSIKYEVNGEHIIGYGTYNPEVLSEYLREYFITPIIKADKEYEAEVATRGNCMICGKELTEGLFICKDCENKTNSRK